MQTRSQRLTAFVAAGSALPFRWGTRDCALWVADWIAAETGRDPAAALRGTFRCHLGSARLQRRAGGLVALVTGLMSFAETAAPVAGDVGIVATPAGDLAGICMGRAGWAMKTKEGVAIVPATLLKAWSL